jgi:hypothetical protein
MKFKLETYKPKTVNGPPKAVEVEVEVNEDQLPGFLSVDMLGDPEIVPNVAIERRDREWVLIICPDGGDTKATVHIRDTGAMTVKDEHDDDRVYVKPPPVSSDMFYVFRQAVVDNEMLRNPRLPHVTTTLKVVKEMIGRNPDRVPNREDVAEELDILIERGGEDHPVAPFMEDR